jgi:type I restriction enzyme S subunit
MLVKTKIRMPVLRFPEFKEDWLLKKGGELFKNKRSKGNEQLPLYSVTLDRGLVPRDSLDRKMSNSSKVENNLQANPMDLVYNMMRMWQGAVGISYQDCMVSPAYIVLEPKKNVDSEFFIRLLQRNRSLYLLQSYSYGLTSDRLRLYFKDFASIPFSVPSLPEQQKIASFLTTIDTRIQQLSRKLELLEQYKKGVMQQIFSQEIRFKPDSRAGSDEEGKDFPEWEEKEFGSVFDFLRTNSFSRKQLDYENGTVKNIHYGDIHTKFKSQFDPLQESVPFINEKIGLDNVPQKSFCKKGDLVIADASEDYKDIGKAIEVINLDGYKLVAGLHTILARDTKKQTVTGFKGYLMQSRYVRLQIMKLATGASVLGISKTNLSKIKIFLPSQFEQQKITDFLRAIDQKINLTKDQLDQTQTFKKGLLQQMFV